MLEHLLGILSGIAAVGLNVAILAVLGSAIPPLSGKRASRSLPDVAVPAACIVALYCWYGIKSNIPLPILLGAIACLAVGVFAYRALRHGPVTALADSQLPALFSLRSVAFAAFYTIAYICVMPPVLSGHLPIATIENRDILNYINIGDYLQHRGPSNIAGLSLSRMHESIPAVFPALQAMAAFLGGDIMQAAMPTLLGVVALIGVVVAAITQTAFALPRSVSIAIAAVMISGPLFRYTSGNFFLSQLMGELVVLLLLAKTLEFVGDNRPKGWTAVATSFAPHYILIYYLYPVLLVIAAALQAFLAAGAWALRGDEARARESMGATVVQWGVGLASCLIAVAAVDPRHFQEMLGLALELSKIQAGWPLSLISPTAMLGLPGDLQVAITDQIASTVAFLAVSAGIGYCYLVRGMGRGPVAGRVLFLISVLAFAGYFAYFYLTGASYQQWKLATYLPLLMSFAWWAACSSIMRATMKSERTVAVATQLLCAVVVVGNLFVYAVREPPIRTFPASYANLRALDMMGGGIDLYVRMSGFGATFLPVYYIRHKTLHLLTDDHYPTGQLLSDSYYPTEHFDLASVSLARPLFVEGKECKPGTPSTTTVLGVGCLYRQPPTVDFGVDYLLSAPLPITIEAEGLSFREAWGRWSESEKVAFRVFASPADLSNAPNGFVNFQIHPHMALRGSQRMEITWGDRRASEVIDHAQTISVPYTRGDWKGADLKSMTITMNLPDAISPTAVDPAAVDGRKLAIGFAAMSVTSAPVGTVIRVDR